MTNEKFRGVKHAYPDAELWQEGQQPVPYIAELSIRTRTGNVVRDALLWPAPRDGYESRLFLSEAISAPDAKNWNAFSIAGRQWFACSWRGVSANLPWLEMLLAHLRAFA